MARRAFLHLGTPKSGTTYLQSLWWQQRDELARQGLLLPGRDEHEQFHASAVVRGNAGVLATMTPRQQGAWDRVVEQVAAWDGDVLVTQEQLVETPAQRAAAAVSRMGEAAEEVHLVVTTRDLARQVPSAWQQRVKHGSATTLRRFCERVAKDDPEFNFWRHQDVPRILDRWAADLPPDRVHVVPLPRPGAPRDLLWERTCDLLGLDASHLSAEAPVSNDSLAPEEVELLRRVNGEFTRAHHDVALSRRIREVLGPHLGQRGRPLPLVLPAAMHAWVVERGNRMADELAASDWHVVGDLDDLRPSPEPPDGVDPDQVPADSVLAVAVPLVAGLVRDRQQAAATAPPPAPVAAEPAPPRGPVGRALTALRRGGRPEGMS